MKSITAKTASLAIFILLAVFTLSGCGSITVVVAKDGPGDTILQYDLFKDCPGTTFEITITQGGKTITSQGTVAGGTLKFGGLQGVNTGQTLEVSIKVVGGPDCGTRFVKNKSYTTGPTALKPARDPNGQPIKDSFIIDVDDFH